MLGRPQRRRIGRFVQMGHDSPRPAQPLDRNAEHRGEFVVVSRHVVADGEFLRGADSAEQHVYRRPHRWRGDAVKGWKALGPQQ